MKDVALCRHLCAKQPPMGRKEGENKVPNKFSVIGNEGKEEQENNGSGALTATGKAAAAAKIKGTR